VRPEIVLRDGMVVEDTLPFAAPVLEPVAVEEQALNG